MAEETGVNNNFKAVPVALSLSASHQQIPGIQLTIDSLKSAHEQCVFAHGYTTKEQQKKIIDAFSGFDVILTNLWQSTDLNLSQAQLQKLHKIFEDTELTDVQSQNEQQMITQVDDAIEDKGYKRDITFSFVESDMILYQLFPEHIAKRIFSILTSSKSKAVLFIGVCMVPVLSFFTGVLTGTADYEHLVVIDIEVWYAYEVFLAVLFSLYAYTWILCANKEAMKMLSTNFEFWFKVFYLVIYLVTFALILDIEKGISGAKPIYNSIPMAIIMEFGCLGATMITDALHVKQTTKIVLSSLSFTRFAFAFLWMQQRALWSGSRDQFAFLYKEADIFLPWGFNGDRLRLNVADILNNAAQILMIFSLKQVIASLTKPNKASVIRVYPKLDYGKSDKNTKVTQKSVKIWKGATIIYGSLLLGGALVGSTSRGDAQIENTIVIHLTAVFAVILLILLCVGGRHGRFGGVRLLYVANGLFLVILMLISIAILLFLWHPVTAAGAIFGFGLSAVYTLKASQLLTKNAESDESEESSKENYIEMKMKIKNESVAVDDEDTADVNHIVAVKVEDIENAHAYDNIDRNESIDPTESQTQI